MGIFVHILSSSDIVADDIEKKVESNTIKEKPKAKKSKKYIALVNLKYNKSIYIIGDELEVLEDNTKEMIERKLIGLK